jgi:hypothetical protein
MLHRHSTGSAWQPQAFLLSKTGDADQRRLAGLQESIPPMFNLKLKYENFK